MAKAKDQTLFKIAVSVFMRGLPEVDVAWFLGKHPELMDLLVAATRKNGFSEALLLQHAPEGIRTVKRIEEISDVLELLAFCGQVTEKYNFNPMGNVTPAHGRRTRTTGTKKPRSTDDSDVQVDTTILAKCRKGSVTYDVVEYLKTAKRAKELLGDAHSLPKLAAIMKEDGITVGTFNLSLILREKFGITPKDITRKKD